METPRGARQTQGRVATGRPSWGQAHHPASWDRPWEHRSTCSPEAAHAPGNSGLTEHCPGPKHEAG